MIVDKITNITKYSGFKPYAESILNFIKRDEQENLEEGRYELDGDSVFALVQSYHTKDISEGFIEAHQLYADLQYIVKGEEYIYWSLLDELDLKEDRHPQADIAFYDGKSVKDRNLLKEGMFGFYFPTDGHMPCISVKESLPMKKIVFKIRCDCVEI